MYLACELTTMFFIGPVAYLLLVSEPWILFPTLWAFFALCLILLLLDRGFDRSGLWRGRNGSGMKRLVLQVIVLCCALGVAVAVFMPEKLLGLPRTRTGLWAMIMIAYPIASVYPQEIIWRVFFFHRYRDVFPNRWTMIAASAAAFGYMHIVFENWIAVVLTMIGGLLFGLTYDRTRSAFLTSVEHALYGCFVFTIGIGEYFYGGAGR